MNAKMRRGKTHRPVLQVEAHGIEPIPESDRTSRPFDLFRLAFGGANTLSSCIIGALSVMLGLSFWQAIAVAVAAILIGGLFLSPIGLIGAASGTNNAVSSSADLGVHGRIVGSLLALITAVLIFAVAVWASGDAIIGTIERVTGITAEPWMLAAAYCFFAILAVVVCVFGYPFMLLVNKISVPAVTALFVVGLFAFGPMFSADYPGVFTDDAPPEVQGLLVPTVVVTLLILMSNPIGYGPFLGDWSRYLPTDTPKPRIVGAVFLSQFATLIPFGFGIMTATIVAAQAPELMFSADASYVIGLLRISPEWFFIPLALIAVIGGVATGTTALYGTGLDFSSIIPGLSRAWATALIGTLSTVLILMGRFAFDMVSSLTASIALIVTLTLPWMVILVIGYATRRAWYDKEALTVFIRRQRGGRYWFFHGWNLRGVGAWLASTLVAMQFMNIPGIFVGALGELWGGVDLSMPAAIVSALVFYPLVLFVFPLPSYVFPDERPWIVPSRDADLQPITGGAARSGARRAHGMESPREDEERAR